MYLCMYVCMYVCLWADVCVYISTFVCMCVCVCKGCVESNTSEVANQQEQKDMNSKCKR